MYNLSLGIISLSSGWLVVKTSFFPIRAILAVIWLLFIPNALYILTDITHMLRQWNLVGDAIKILLAFQYTLFIFLGIILFILAFYPFEKLLVKLLLKRRNAIVALLVVINFIIAFGVAMGRIERTNSWEVFINIKKVINDGINILTSLEAMALVIFFGILGNIIYFCLKTEIIKYSFKLAQNFLRTRGKKDLLPLDKP